MQFEDDLSKIGSHYKMRAANLKSLYGN